MVELTGMSFVQRLSLPPLGDQPHLLLDLQTHSAAGNPQINRPRCHGDHPDFGGLWR